MTELVNSARPADIEAREVTHRAHSKASYTRTAIVLHWLIALCILGQILFGWYLEEIPRGTPARSWYVNFHKSTGIVLGLLILFRLFWRLWHKPPALPSSTPLWQRLAASLSHWLLYACMIVMPLSGYIASNFSKWGVKFFNAVSFPPWGVEDKNIYAFFNTTHVVTSYILVALIGAHLIGALSHGVARDGIFQRMLIRRR